MKTKIILEHEIFEYLFSCERKKIFLKETKHNSIVLWNCNTHVTREVPKSNLAKILHRNSQSCDC
jgi:hypothetical protein